jgi:hypothetical protein
MTSASNFGSASGGSRDEQPPAILNPGVHIRALVDAISILDRLPPDEVTAILKRSVVAAYPGADEGDLYELRELRKSEDEAKALAELVRPKTGTKYMKNTTGNAMRTEAPTSPGTRRKLPSKAPRKAEQTDLDV